MLSREEHHVIPTCALAHLRLNMQVFYRLKIQIVLLPAFDEQALERFNAA